MEKAINKFMDFDVKGVDDHDRSFWITASTEEKDRDGDIIMASGWKLKNFRKNPVILYGHIYGGKDSLPVANATEIKIEDNKLKAKLKFIEKDVYEFADTVYKMYKNKHLRTFSVGFIGLKKEPLENQNENNFFPGYRFTSQELLEITCCPVPSNVGAMKEKGMRELIAKGYGFEMPAENKNLISKSEPFNLEQEVAPDNKELLIHHTADGKVSFRAVKACMAMVLGARIKTGIVKHTAIMEYAHLTEHYKEFGEEPPIYEKGYSGEDLKDLFDDVWYQELSDLILRYHELNDEENYVKSGRVLSAKNRTLVDKCIEVLNELKEASEPKEEPKAINEDDEETLQKLQADLAEMTANLQ